jgi:hypothetical protein
MVDVQHYLKGEKIDKSNLYQTCYLLSKWHKSQGMNYLQIRDSIYEWATQNNLIVKSYLNVIINKALSDKKPLTQNIIVYVNDGDVKEIVRRFDSKNTRMVALSMLCYAKIHANKMGEFSLSSVAIGAWVGIHDSNIRRRYIKELINFEYVEKISVPKNNKKWANGDEDKNCKYIIRFPLKNSGDYKLVDNDIEDLYKQIFIKK